MHILTIESSCDETSAAIIQDGTTILSNVIASQIPVHAKYGGVVPELASRNHIVDIHHVIDSALAQAALNLGDLDGIAATAGPGLVGSLLVGFETAKSLAFALDLPFVGVNHLEGHLTAILLTRSGDEPSLFPYLGVIVSGGHTDLYVVRGISDYLLLGRTRDDAAGEAFDKIAKTLGLGYPGGAVIDRLGALGNPSAIEFPRPMLQDKSYDFSFSGLKTAVIRHLDTSPITGETELHDLAASVQEAICDVIVTKALAAATEHNLLRIIFSGGVACNTRLRSLSSERATAVGKTALFAPPILCTDNAAMLGPVAHAALLEQRQLHPGFHAWDVHVDRSFPLGISQREATGNHR